MTDAATAKPSKVTCDGCRKPIKLDDASIFAGTADGNRERHHLACWPYRLKAVDLQERLAR